MTETHETQEDGLPRLINRDGIDYKYSGRIEGNWFYRSPDGKCFIYNTVKKELSKRASVKIKRVIEQGW